MKHKNRKQQKQKTAETENSRNSVTDETVKTVKTVEHYIEGPRKPGLQEKQVFLVINHTKVNACGFSKEMPLSNTTKRCFFMRKTPLDTLCDH